MNIRPYRELDEPRLREIFGQQGFEYDFPDLSDSEFLSVQVVTDDEDRAVMAIAARRTVELYMLCDAKWSTPGWRLSAFLTLHEVMRQILSAIGIKDVHAWLPPQVEKSFGRRLKKLGWSRPLWTDFWRSTER